MALRWDLSEVKDHETVCFYEATADDPNHGVVKGDRVMNPVTNALIWASIGVDLPGITRKDAGEFFARLRILEQTNGPMLFRPVGPDGKRPAAEDSFITEDEVLAHVGLTANVSPLSRSLWLRKLGKDMDRLVSRFEKKREAAEAVTP